MTQHKHSESHRHAGGGEGQSNDEKLHKNWRVWLAIGIMLTAMATYVLTLDDSVVLLFTRQ
jgi:hypothetical protein